MELDLPTPVSDTPSQGTGPHSPAIYPPPKYTCKYTKLALKNAGFYIRTIYNLATILGALPNVLYNSA
jgi:hypothetical protein